MVKDDQNRETAPAALSLSKTIRNAQAGDPEAFRRIYQLFAPTVHTVALRIVRDQHEAEDVSQHVFAKLLTCIGQYEERSQPFIHWLSRVTRNAAVDHVRRRRPVPLEDAESMVASRPAAEPDLIDTLKIALRTLPDEQRRIVLMRHLIGLSPDEIAEKTGRTTASVNGLHFRARRQLRNELSGLGLAPATSARAA